jgi:hypothetical protein
MVCCYDFGVYVHILFSLFTTDSKYVKLPALPNLKLPNVKFWRYILACVEDIFICFVFFSLIRNSTFLPSIPNASNIFLKL